MAITASYLILEYMVSNVTSGSVRVDLLGGTLDLNPINLIIPHVVTLNLATSLKAKVALSEIDFDGLEIVSKDYQSTERFYSKDINEENFHNGFFGKLSFVVQIFDLFKLHRGLRVELESGSPPGAGLGGSSAMGVTIFHALCKWTKTPLNKIEAIQKVNGLEGRILDSGPAGYQDYYPALFGGVLALVPKPGMIEVNQMFDPALKSHLEENLTLVYSGDTRLSGINNWEVYKAFFNKESHVRLGLNKIAELSHQAYQAMINKKYTELPKLIAEEGAERKKLFPGIMTPSMLKLEEELKGKIHGIKVCGAGGGGCFLIAHPNENKAQVEAMVRKHSMTLLTFSVEPPLS